MRCGRMIRMAYYVFDIGQIPPYNRTFDLRKRKLRSCGWMEIETKERVFHLRKGDVELYCDDTSLGFFISPDIRKAKRWRGEAFDLLSDWRTASRFLKRTVRRFETMMPVRMENVSEGLYSILKQETEALLTAVFQGRIDWTRHRDLALQKARLEKCATSPFLEGAEKRKIGGLVEELDSADEYLNACYMDSDRMGVLASQLSAFLLSVFAIIEVFCADVNLVVERLPFILPCLLVAFLLFLLALPRR